MDSDYRRPNPVPVVFRSCPFGDRLSSRRMVVTIGRMQTFHTSRRVEFRETDAAGIAHFTSLIAYMEEAEHDFLRHLALSVVLRDEQGEISWPRVAANAEFLSAVRFEDEIDVELRILRMGTKSVTYGFVLSHRGRAVAKGSISAVCCRVAAHQPPQSIPIPDWIRERLAPWVSEQA